MTLSSTFIVCIFLVSVVKSDKPRNTLTELGRLTNLACCSEHGSVVWKHQLLNFDGVSNQICYGQTCKEGYSIDNSTPGCFHLIINSTSISAAGLYHCSEIVASTLSSGAYVVVYNYSCGDNFDNSDDLVEGDIVKFHCSVSWRGKWPFAIRWVNDRGIEMQYNIIPDLNSNYSTSLTINVSRPIFPPYTVQFVFLNNKITDPNVDKSCPPTVNWSSRSRRVKHQPTNMKLSCPSERCERMIGDTINCSAFGDPIPEFHWLNWNDKIIGLGSVLELQHLGSHIYTCVATNVIRGTNFSTTRTVNVDVKSKPAIDCSQCTAEISCSVWTKSLTAIAIVLVLLQAVLFFRWLVRRIMAKRHEQSIPQREVPQPEDIELPPPLRNILSPPHQDSPQQKEEIKAGSGEPSMPTGVRTEHKVHINHREYNNDLSSPNSMLELRPLEICQPNDSEISEDERPRAHPDIEVASLLGQESTDTETEDDSALEQSRHRGLLGRLVEH